MPDSMNTLRVLLEFSNGPPTNSGWQLAAPLECWKFKQEIEDPNE
jgi:hypothetical protein